MVAIFTGLGAGFERGSGSAVGSAGLLGSASFGRGGEGVSVNVSTGNLLITRQDEFLVGRGPDVGISRTYNSVGALDENGDNWRQSTDRRVFDLTGTLNAAGSAVKRVSADGSEITYNYQTIGGVAAYWTTEGSGAHDKLTNANNKWTWTDGDSRSTETYEADGASWRISDYKDTSGNKLTFTYSASKLTKVETVDGGYTEYSWSGNNITQIKTSYTDSAGINQSLTRTRYAYDNLNRLETVTTDLSPEDNSDSDGVKYEVVYNYSGTTNLVSSITQTDGSRIDFEYDNGKVEKITQFVTNSNGEPPRVMTFDYDQVSGGQTYTAINDPSGTEMRLYYNTQKELTQTRIVGGSNDVDRSNYFAYDAAGNVETVTDAEGNVTSYGFNERGNTVSITDAQNNTSSNIYDSNSNLRRSYHVASTDTSSGTSIYKHYVYDIKHRLRYAIDGNGGVQEFRYDGFGNLTHEILYSQHKFANTSALQTETGMNQWRDALDRTESQLTRHYYDAKGNVVRTVEFGDTRTDGYQTVDEGFSDFRYTHDSAGRLLTSRTTADIGNTFVYDGLGRTISSTDLNGGTTGIVFDDATTKTIVTSANGHITTSTYNRAGNLISELRAGANDYTGTATFEYDKNGRLRIETDASGRKTYYIYDKAGNRTAQISQSGHVQEFRYDKTGRQIAHARYTNVKQGADLTNLITTLENPNNTLLAEDVRFNADSALNHNAYDIWQWTSYDSRGQISHTVLGDGSVTTYAYDTAGQLIKTYSYFNKLSASQLAALRSGAAQANANLPSSYSAKDQINRTFYNKAGQLVGTLNGDGYLTKIVYDNAGRKIRDSAYGNVTGASIRSSGTFYALQQSLVPSAVKDAHVYYVYDGQGHLRFTVDARDKVTENVYGSGGLAIGLVRGTISHHATLSGVSDYSYTAIKAAVSALGNKSLNRLTQSIYNTNRQLAFNIDEAGAVTRFQYDAQGDLVKTTQYAVVRSVETTLDYNSMASWAAGNTSGARISRNYYTAGGLLKFVIDAEGYVTQNNYDQADRLTKVSRWTDRVTASAGWSTQTVQDADKGALSQTVYTYDNEGRVSEVKDDAGVSHHYLYYANGELAWDIEAFGDADDESRVKHIYDGAGRKVQTQEWSQAYVASGSDGKQNEVKYFYDGLGNLSRIQRTRNFHDVTTQDQNTYYTYDKRGNILTETNAEGGVTAFEYNAFNQVIKVTDPKGYFSTNDYNQAGQLIKATDAELIDTDYTYTEFGEQFTVNRGVEQTQYRYDKVGRVTKVQDVLGNFEQYTLDAFGQRVTVRNKQGGLTYNTFSKRGELKQTRVIMNAYNADFTGAVASEVINKYDYDSRGNQINMIEAFGLAEARTTTFVYNDLDQLIEKKGNSVHTYASGAENTKITQSPTEYFFYDKRGNLIESKDANGARTLYYYDRMNRVTHQISPEGTLVRNYYDANSNLIETKVFATTVDLPSDSTGAPPAGSGNFRRTTFSYDRLNRMVDSKIRSVQTATYDNYLTISGTQDYLQTSYEYDDNGNVIKVTDPNGGETYSYYDQLGRKTSQIDADGYRTDWTYNDNDNVSRERRFKNQTTGPVTTSTPASVAYAGATGDRITEYTYDGFGNRKTETRLYVKEFNVSAASMEVSVSSEIKYDYNALGQVTKKTQATGDYIIYQYDTQGRLTHETQSQYLDYLGENVNPKVNYVYNGLNDIVRVYKYGKSGSTAASSTLYSYTLGGRLTAVEDANGFSRTYRYDAKGQVVREEYLRVTNSGIDIEGIGYDYDKEGRIIAQGAVIKNNGQWSRQTGEVVNNVYTEGRLTTVQTRYNAFGEVSERGVNGVYAEKMDYDNAGRLWRTTSGDGAYKYFMYDKNGNQTLVVTSDGANIYQKSMSQILGLWGVSSTATGTINANNIRLNNQEGIVATLTQYDNRNLAVKVWEPKREFSGNSLASYTTSRSHNAFSEIVAETDARGNTVNYEYNALGRRTKIESPLVSVTAANGVDYNTRPTENYYYDRSGRLVASKDANGNLTMQTLLAGTGYDGAQALTSEVKNATSNGSVFASVKTEYDIQGNARETTNQLGKTTESKFDKMGQVTQIDHAGGLVENFVYDGLGQQIQRWNNELGSIHKALTDYDGEGRVIKQVAFGGDITTTAYTFNAYQGSFLLQSYQKTSTGRVVATEMAKGVWTKKTTLENGKVRTDLTNLFGQTTQTNNYSNQSTDYIYDNAGRLAQVKSYGSFYGTDIINEETYTYYNTNKIHTVEVKPSDFQNSEISITNVTRTTTYGYDQVGNLTSEKLQEDLTVSFQSKGSYAGKNYAAGTSITLNDFEHKDAIATYDALGRLTLWKEKGSPYFASPSTTPFTPYARREFKYDAQGNIRNSKSNFNQSNNELSRDQGNYSNAQEKNYWYLYDAMNRVTRSQGTLSAPGGSISRGSNGTDITYDEAGQRKTVNSGNGLETYAYSDAGHIESVTIGADLRATYIHDKLGRITQQIEYKKLGVVPISYAIYDSVKSYNAKSELTNETVNTIREGGGAFSTDSYKTQSTYSYAADNAGQLLSVSTDIYDEGSATSIDKTTLTTNEYIWRDGVLKSRAIYLADTSKPNETQETDFFYTQNGTLVAQQVEDGRPRIATYVLDTNGQVLRRDEQDDNASRGDPHEIWYRFGGREMGFIGNNGTLNTNYNASIDDRAKVDEPSGSNSGPFRHNYQQGVQADDFDTNYEALNSYNQGSVAGSYTVQSGDSLQGIAQAIYGDSSLWYKLAQANGLSSGAALTQGQSLRLPAGVFVAQNNAGTVKPYDPATVIGEINPTTPKPKKRNILASIGLVFIAAIVTLATAGALAGALPAALGGLGTGVSTGVSAAFSGGLGLTGAAAIGIGAASAAVGSIASQAVGVATGIQEKFSWSAVALSAISGGVGSGLSGTFNSLGKAGGAFARGAAGSAVSQGIGVATGLQDSFSWAGVAAAGVGSAAGTAFAGSAFGRSIAGRSQFAGSVATNSARAITNAATRSAIDGTSFGDNIRAAIPDVIGQALGDAFSTYVSDEIRMARETNLVKQTAIDQNYSEELAANFATTYEGLARNGLEQLLAAGPLSKIPVDFEPRTRAQKQAYYDVAGQIEAGYNAQLSPEEAAYLVGLKNVIERRAADISSFTAQQANDFIALQKTFNLSLINTDIYLDVSVPDLLPTGVTRLSDSGVTAALGVPLKLRDEESGYFAAIYYNSNDNEYVYANRGSGDGNDWKTNFDQGGGRETGQYSLAIGNARKISKQGENVLYTGHSLGGGLAAAQAIVTDGRAVVFNAAGVHSATVARYGANFNNVTNQVLAYHIDGEGLNLIQDNRDAIAAGVLKGTSAGPLKVKLAGRAAAYQIANTPYVRGTRRGLDAVHLGNNHSTYYDNVNFNRVSSTEISSLRRNLHGIPSVAASLVNVYDRQYPGSF